jgi:hypothetical protein
LSSGDQWTPEAIGLEAQQRITGTPEYQRRLAAERERQRQLAEQANQQRLAAERERQKRFADGLAEYHKRLVEYGKELSAQGHQTSNATATPSLETVVPGEYQYQYRPPGTTVPTPPANPASSDVARQWPQYQTGPGQAHQGHIPMTDEWRRHMDRVTANGPNQAKGPSQGK